MLIVLKPLASDEDFVKDDSALQSILDETGIQDIPQQTVVPHRHTMATSRVST